MLHVTPMTYQQGLSRALIKVDEESSIQLERFLGEWSFTTNMSGYLKVPKRLFYRPSKNGTY
jgi:hypothetical protein